MNKGTKTGSQTEWFMATAFTIVALVSLFDSYDGSLSDQKSEIQWAVSGTCVALVFAVIGVSATMFVKEQFIGTWIEGGVSILTVGFWAGVLPFIMDPENLLALRPITGGVLNANLYFFSWGGFVMSYLTLNNFARDMRGLTEELLHMEELDILCMTGFVLMMAAVRVYKAKECSTDYTIEFHEEICSRISFAVSVGNLSTIICFVWQIIVGFMDPAAWMLYAEAATSAVLLVMWSFGLAYITYGGEKSPAIALGNLYFFTVGSFALAVALFVRCFENLRNRNKNFDNTPTQQSNAEDAEMQQE